MLISGTLEAGEYSDPRGQSSCQAGLGREVPLNGFTTRLQFKSI